MRLCWVENTEKPVCGKTFVCGSCADGEGKASGKDSCELLFGWNGII